MRYDDDKPQRVQPLEVTAVLRRSPVYGKGHDISEAMGNALDATTTGCVMDLRIKVSGHGWDKESAAADARAKVSELF